MSDSSTDYKEIDNVLTSDLNPEELGWLYECIKEAESTGQINEVGYFKATPLKHNNLLIETADFKGILTISTLPLFYNELESQSPSNNPSIDGYLYRQMQKND